MCVCVCVCVYLYIYIYLQTAGVSLFESSSASSDQMKISKDQKAQTTQTTL